MKSPQSASFGMGGRTSAEISPSLVQRSVLSSSLQVVFGLLAALAVYGAVITIAFNNIVPGNGPSD
jgi:hypothetical protein